MNGTRPVVAVPGVHLGHWTDDEARTGCSVLLFDRSVLAAVEVRGAAPGSRELETLAPGATGQRVDALLLTGGSAFGLAAADGVMRFLRERSRGFPTAAGPVPIIPAAVIYDLSVGKAEAPGPEAGYEACQAAVPLADARFGAIGAGIGARFGAVQGRERVRSGGIGVSQYALPGAVVSAIAVLNAFGAQWAGNSDAEEDPRLGYLRRGAPQDSSLLAGTNTTLIAVIIDGACDHETLGRCCVAAHDGLARSIAPAHTPLDGDLAFAVALAEGVATLDQRLRLTMAVELAVERAIRHATVP